MDAMITFAFERINEHIQQLSERVKQLETRCTQLERKASGMQDHQPRVVKDELINVKVAKTILDVSRNTFLTMVSKGVFTPIRMNLRTIRYSRTEIQRFIDEKRGLAAP